MIDYNSSISEHVHITEVRSGQEVTHTFVLNTQRPTEVVTDLQPDLANQLLAQEQAVLAAHNLRAARIALKPKVGPEVYQLRVLGLLGGLVTSYLIADHGPFDNATEAIVAGTMLAAVNYLAIGEYIPRARNARNRQERRRIQGRINLLKQHATQLPLPAEEIEPVNE